MDFAKLLLCGLATSIFSLASGYPQSDFHHFPLEDFLSSHESILEDNGKRDRESQSFFPSFSPFEPPPLGHSRPFLFQPEGAYSQKANAPQQDLNQGALKKQFNEKASSSTPRLDLLGSGNFGVIKGGTFYNDHDGESSDVDYQYKSFFHNGHGRPSYYPRAQNPKPQRQQFANFRDFADINTPSYSQYVVVYAKQNDSANDSEGKVVRAPKNIIERLAMLDEETSSSTSEPAPSKKLSMSKRKLAKLQPEKKWKAKSDMKSTTTPPNDLPEPMLALS